MATWKKDLFSPQMLMCCYHQWNTPFLKYSLYWLFKPLLALWFWFILETCSNLAKGEEKNSPSKNIKCQTHFPLGQQRRLQIVIAPMRLSKGHNGGEFPPRFPTVSFSQYPTQPNNHFSAIDASFLPQAKRKVQNNLPPITSSYSQRLVELRWCRRYRESDWKWAPISCTPSQSITHNVNQLKLLHLNLWRHFQSASECVVSYTNHRAHDSWSHSKWKEIHRLVTVKSQSNSNMQSSGFAVTCI